MNDPRKLSPNEPGGMSRRRLLQVAGAGALTITAGGLLAACGSDSSGSGGSSGSTSTAAAASVTAGLETGHVHNLILLSNEWNTVMSDGAKRTAEFLGLKYTESLYDLDETVALDQAQQAIAAGANMIIIQAADGSGIPAIGKLCEKEGVFLSNMEANAPWYSPIDAGDHFKWFFCQADWVGYYDSTKYMLQQVADKTGGGGKILQVSGFPGSPIDAIRTDAAKRALADFPEMELLGSLPGEWSPEGGQKATEELISKYGDPDAIIAANDGSLTGVLAALKGLGYTPGEDVLSCGADGATDILKQIQAGAATSTTFAPPIYFGIAAVTRVFDGLNGFQPTAPERQMAFSGLLTNKDNVDGIIERYVDNSNLPFDPALLSRSISKKDWDPQVELLPIDVDQYWEFAGVKKPAGYENPKEYTKSREDGQFEEIGDLYTKQYKIKFDDFSYAGIEA